MIQLPVADPGVPDTRSPVRLLVWVGRHQVPTLVAGVVFGIIWMLAQALMPFAIGRAIEDGIVEGDNSALAAWSLVLLGLGATQAIAGVMRHRNAVANWLQATFRLSQLVAHHAARSGGAIRGRLSTGEVVATVANDAMRAGGAYDITARLSGAIVSYIVVAVILLSSSVVLGLLVLLGVPVLVLLLGTVIRPLQARQRDQRHEVGRLTALGADTAAGLRVLRGIGGEQAFFDRYRESSQQVRIAGVRVALPQSTLDAAQVFLPGVFVVLVTWIGARFALSGRINAGELVAFYGYAAFLVIPLRTAAEAVDKVTRAVVGARRMLDVLAVEPAVGDPKAPAAEPPPGSEVADADSGLVIEPGLLTCVVSANPHESAASRGPAGPLRGLRGRHARWCPAPGAAARCRAPAHPRRRAGPDAVLRNAPDGARSLGRCDRRRHPRGGRRSRQPRTSSRRSPTGSTSSSTNAARSFSGGQRQRLALVRALLADPEILILVEPTSAVDAHTEARIAARLRQARSGRTTVVVTASPLVLDRADAVAFLTDGRVTATGVHRELLRESPDYRLTVTRGEEEDAA